MFLYKSEINKICGYSIQKNINSYLIYLTYSQSEKKYVQMDKLTELSKMVNMSVEKVFSNMLNNNYNMV